MKLRFDLLKQMRQGKTDKRKIYSTSVLAQVNQLALTTDVACMPGGGIGQICNAIPTDEKHDEVIILAGTNEIKNAPPNEFVFTIEKTVEKLRALAEGHKVTVVLPLTPVVCAEEAAKAQFLQKKFEAIDVINIVTLDTDPVEFEDDVHPSKSGTEEIVRQLNDAFGKDIVLPDATSDDLTTTRRYSKVQSIFKAGCRACSSTEFCSYLCDDCKEAAVSVDTKELSELIEDFQTTLFPPIGGNDIDMRDQSYQNKRKRDDSGDNGDNDPKKSS